MKATVTNFHRAKKPTSYPVLKLANTGSPNKVAVMMFMTKNTYVILYSKGDSYAVGDTGGFDGHSGGNAENLEDFTGTLELNN